MEILKSKKFLKDYSKKIIKVHKQQEALTIEKIENLIFTSNNLKELLLNPLSRVYGIEQKKENLKEFFTADINKKIRLYMKPVGEYPYNAIEISKISFEEIDDTHYGDG